MQTALFAPLAHRIPEACRRIGLGRSTVYALIKAGHLKAVRIGGRTLILERELQRLLDGTKGGQR